ncbi:hypothetical protein RND81_09G039400 [Saponaria officinalis]|uniref:Uncharacterized protein n=1 Tax=Saponaria officinalis TaxID=3572 RepID=A0AAW1IIG0_SAPOF
MSTISINLMVISVIISIFLLAASVPTLANGYYQKPSSNPYEKPSIETPNGSRSGSGITCQSFGNACPAEGVYKCCDGYVCRPNTVGGISLCLPPLVPGEEEEYQKCRDITKICIDYGDYDCCGDLSCVPGSPANFIGAGVCLPMGGKMSSRNVKCQQQNNLCQPYGQYQCCPELSCVDPRTLTIPPLPIDLKLLPPGLGVCATLPKI